MLDFKINPNEVDKIGELSKEEKVFRVKQLDYFNKIGFPNKRDEDWKFSDLREIFLKNFNKLEFNLTKPKLYFFDIKAFPISFSLYLILSSFDNEPFRILKGKSRLFNLFLSFILEVFS